MRFLTREQIQRLYFSPSTASYCKRRLSLLYHNAYLDRLYLPTTNAFGASKAVYTLASRGASVVAQNRKMERKALDWRPSLNSRELYFIRHTLATNDFHIALLRAAGDSQQTLSWTDERALRRREMKDYIDDPKHHGRRIAVVPDGYFTIGGAQGWPSAFAVEIDRATVEEKPFKEKIRAYGEWKLTGAYERRYGTSSLRVLWVVADFARDLNRLQRMKRWTEAEGGRSLFWFAALDQLAPSTILKGHVWQIAGREGLFSINPQS